MPRGPVVASPVPGAVPQNPGDVIQSSVWNATVNDIYNIFNTIQPIEYGGTGVSDGKPLDNSFGIKNSTDPTKVGVFSAAGIPTTTTRTYTLPAASGTLALTTDVGGNIGLAASVAANALTIALKGADGNDPSASNAVNINFRNVTPGAGTSTNLSITAATSLVISSGSTMGFTSASAGRLWIVGFNDGGTFRLGAVNVLSSQDVYPLRDGIYSSTAEGGAGTADSAQVIYTATAITDKAMTILGYMDWAAGLVTAGTWAIAPTTIQLMEPGIAKPGETIQIRRTTASSLGSGTVTTPVDDTIPQITEGTEFMTVAISPAQAPNLLSVSSKAFYNHTVDGAFVTNALFRDATANAITASSIYLVLGGGGGDSLVNVAVKAGAVTSTTFRIRGGANIGGTLRFNGAIARYYGGVINSFLEVQEIMA